MKALTGALLLLAVALVNGEFNLTTALRGVGYSNVAYCYTPHIAAWNCSQCPQFPAMVDVTAAVDEDHDEAGWTGYNPSTNEIVLSFRGTENLQGWILDFDFPQVDYVPTRGNCTGCKIHEGFYWGWQRLSPTLLPAIHGLAKKYPNADLFVAGHSLGAAMATLAYSEVVDTLGITGKQRLYNFGCPRIGNAALVKFLETELEPHHEHYRSTNFGDPIPHLPPTFFDQWGGIWGDWLHIPREVYFTNPFVPPQTDYRVCNGNWTNEDPTCADSTPWYDMLGFTNHTTYLDIGMGC